MDIETEPGRMRILQVLPYYYPAVRYGGPVRCVHGLATSLVRRGHQVSVYTTNMDGAGNLDVPLDRPVVIDGVSVHYFPVPALRRLFWCPSLARALRHDISNFDVVHLQTLYLWPIYAGARAAQRAGIPYVMSPHGMMVGRMIRQHSRLVKMAWINLVEKRSLRHASALQVNSELEGREAKALGLELPEVISVPVGVAPPAACALLNVGSFSHLPRPYVLFVGRVHWTKGLDRLITAWKSVPGVHLVIAGNDDVGYSATLSALAARENVADRVHFIGAVSDEQKWALYANAKLFVLPSYSDSFGIVVAEAMAMGCPVVVTPQVGVADVVRNAGTGIVTDNAPPALGKAIGGFLADSGQLARAGLAGQRAAKELFSWDSIAVQTEAIYRKILRPNWPEPQRRISSQSEFAHR
jgi:glycosyltransferase involved in cell wall biosynthesis